MLSLQTAAAPPVTMGPSIVTNPLYVLLSIIAVFIGLQFWWMSLFLCYTLNPDDGLVCDVQILA